MGPGSVAMPQWPGPVLALGGAAVGIGALVAAAIVAAGTLEVANPDALTWLALAGGIAFAAGLAYAAVRQLRVRSFLPPERYRGPSVILLLGLVIVVGTILTAPFALDAAVLVLGEGELSFLGAVALLTATQIGLLLVSWLFVFRPNALAGLPGFPGPDAARALRLGLGWGVVAWLGASVASFVAFTVLDAIGLDPQPQAAEQALAIIDPWLAVIAVVVLAPIAEEIFFRGVVFNALLREGSRRWAFIGSSALFAVIHLSLVAVLPIFLLGLALAWVYDRTRSLLAPIAMHLTVNGISVAIALLARYEVIQLPA
jgi:membrane protease YdiL (CAAX protease family)